MSVNVKLLIMSSLRNIVVALMASVMLLACSGQKDSGALPALRADRNVLDLASHDRITFKVTLDGSDVTAESIINNGTDLLSGGVFMPQESGLYTFTADFAGRVSEPVTVKVYNSKPQVESPFRKHVCVTEFTGAWCINCPEGYDDMWGILSKPTMKKYEDRIEFLAFHSNVEGTDTLGISNTGDVKALLPASNAFPSFAVDFRKSASGLLVGEGLSLFSDSIADAFDNEKHPVCCGVSLSSTVSADGKKADITVKVKTDYTNPYSLVLLIVQNRIKGYQKTELYPEGTGEYIHNHVVRKVVTSYAGKFAGEDITEDGFVKAGEEAVKTFSVDVDSKWVLENTKVYALVMDCNDEMNNLNACPIVDGNSDYDYKQN